MADKTTLIDTNDNNKEIVDWFVLRHLGYISEFIEWVKERLLAEPYIKMVDNDNVEVHILSKSTNITKIFVLNKLQSVLFTIDSNNAIACYNSEQASETFKIKEVEDEERV